MTTFTTQDRQDAQREPVAWMYVNELGVQSFTTVKAEAMNHHIKIPLYTYPKTPLSDEQISYFTHEMILACGVHPNSADINIIGLIEIARAIERAHGIGE